MAAVARINVTGNAGAGKTTTAKAIASAIGVPYSGLDSVVWQPGWKKTPADLRAKLETELVLGESWVIDGVSKRIRDAADLVIFLDVPRVTCALRALRRTASNPFRTRAGLPEDCPEWRIVPRMLQIIWRFEHLVAQELRFEARNEPSRYLFPAPSMKTVEIVELVAATQQAP